MNCVTKWAIIIVSVLLAVFIGIALVRRVTDSHDYDVHKIIDIIVLGCCFLLACLSCLGAFTENACLCYIALVVTIIVLAERIWALVRCFTRDTEDCETIDYVARGIVIAVLVLLVFCIWTFIASIKK